MKRPAHYLRRLTRSRRCAARSRMPATAALDCPGQPVTVTAHLGSDRGWSACDPYLPVIPRNPGPGGRHVQWTCPACCERVRVLIEGGARPGEELSVKCTRRFCGAACTVLVRAAMFA